MIRSFSRFAGVAGACTVLLACTATPAGAQARGSAEASAAARTNPHNNAMRKALSAERAYERAAADAAARGVPPPERVFERVNGQDRAR